MPDPRLAKLPDLSPQMVPPVQRQPVPLSLPHPDINRTGMAIEFGGVPGVETQMPAPPQNTVPPIGNFAKMQVR